MDKREFLDILKQTLYGEVSSEVVEKNISYYEQYISSQKLKEDDVIIKLGDPRLIARSIIESERAASQKNKTYGSQRNEQRYHYDSDNSKNAEGGYQQENKNRRIRFLSNLTWRQKLSVALILLILIFIIILIGRIIIGLLFTFGIPILLIIILLALFKKRQ